MGIGFSIFLLALGAILAFALDYTIVGLDIHIIGWILMAAGLIGLILTMVILAPRRRRTVRQNQSLGMAPAVDTAHPGTVVDEHINDDIR